MKERETAAMSGYLMLVLLLGLLGFSVWSIVQEATGEGSALKVLGWINAMIATFVAIGGLFTVQPNQGVVLQLFGKYVGTVKSAGLRWTIPFYSKHKVSLRVRNFETNHLKVNDLEGNPIEIAAVVVWKVIDTAEAMFQVDNYDNYVHVQSEAALRNMATAYAYDSHEEGHVSLRGHTAVVAAHLQKEIHDRLAVAGVEVVEARISHLAYAPEIAAAMLQRQQASAIIAARQRIVEGAVGMVEMALDMLAKRNVVELDAERRAAMVSNLLVVLCGERGTQPVVNAGTIYH